MKNMNGSEWIAQFLANDPPRSKSLVVTIFGDAIVPHGGTVWLGSLIELLEPFGVNDRLLRTSVFRLAQEGWLGSQRDGRRSSYSITPGAMARFVHAYRRIYAPLNVHWDGSWTLIINPGAIDAVERGALRKELLWEGYALLAPGVFGHPAANRVVLQEMLVRQKVEGKLLVLQASSDQQVSGQPLQALVSEGWDLRSVADGYRQFIARFEPLLALLQDGPAISAQQAFMMRSLLIHAYRRVQLHDPQLPVELLPEPWPGAQAYQLARDIYRLVFDAAEQHILAALRSADPATPEVEAAFYQRFGGLH
ncbi:MAG: phenylacetic acid degradation operon negative regulatory protein PaaX [Sphingomonadaceae bacterium]